MKNLKSYIAVVVVSSTLIGCQSHSIKRNTSISDQFNGEWLADSVLVKQGDSVGICPKNTKKGVRSFFLYQKGGQVFLFA